MHLSQADHYNVVLRSVPLKPPNAVGDFLQAVRQGYGILAAGTATAFAQAPSGHRRLRSLLQINGTVDSLPAESGTDSPGSLFAPPCNVPQQCETQVRSHPLPGTMLQHFTRSTANHILRN